MINLEEKDRFLQRYKLPRLNQEETENMNRPTKVVKLKIWSKALKKKKVQDLMAIQVNSIITLREALTLILLKFFPKNFRGRNTPKLILWSLCYPDTKIRQAYHKKKKKNYRPVSLMKRDPKILNKILAHGIQQYMKRIIVWPSGIYPRDARIF